jgi:hypothetical protein
LLLESANGFELSSPKLDLNDGRLSKIGISDFLSSESEPMFDSSNSTGTFPSFFADYFYWFLLVFAIDE